MPPKYSALKINGQKACDLARKGAEVALRGREVSVYEFGVKSFDWPIVGFEIFCGSGTYVRSLIHDLGQELGCGAYVRWLRRVSVGGFSVSDAVEVDELSNKVDQCLLPLSVVKDVLGFIDLDAEDWLNLADGKTALCNKVEHDGFYLAFYKEKVVGVINVFDHAERMKFKKRIFT